jgi:NitT/TauT family transport system substrate-binding protein
MLKPIHGVLAAFVVALSAAMLVACGSDEGEKAATGGVVELKVGALPIVDDAPLFVAIEKGFFEKERLKVTPQMAQGGAAIIPSLQSGDVQFGFSNSVSTLIASSKGLKLKVVAMGVTGGKTEKTAYPGGILVKESSRVRRPEDLANTTIGVNTLNNIWDVVIKASLEKHGVAPEQVKLTEIPFPEAQAALDKDRIPAAGIVEPFMTAMEQGGARNVINPFAVTAPALEISEYVTTEQYFEENRDVVERFARAMAAANEYARTHPAAVRQVLRGNTEIPPELIEGIRLPTWSKQVDRKSIELLDSLSRRYGLYEEAVDIDELVPSLAMR